MLGVAATQRHLRLLGVARRLPLNGLDAANCRPHGSFQLRRKADKLIGRKEDFRASRSDFVYAPFTALVDDDGRFR